MDHFGNIDYGVEFEDAREAVLALASAPIEFTKRPSLPLRGSANGSVIACRDCRREFTENAWRRLAGTHTCATADPLLLAA